MSQTATISVHGTMTASDGVRAERVDYYFALCERHGVRRVIRHLLALVDANVSRDPRGDSRVGVHAVVGGEV